MSEKDQVLKDCSTACGCTADIGTVISPEDYFYDFSLSGTKEEVEVTYSKYVEEAKKVCPVVKAVYEDKSVDGKFTRKGKLTFSCTAEKMIFQLRTGAV